MFTKILVPYDGSPHSQRALVVAAELAHCTEGQLHVIYAFDPLPADLGEPNYENLLNRVLSWANDIVTEGVASVKDKGVQVTHDVLEGPAAAAILRVAEAEKFDLIIMGSRGLGQFAGLLVGSVSDRVLHHAKVPVMVVR